MTLTFLKYFFIIALTLGLAIPALAGPPDKPNKEDEIDLQELEDSLREDALKLAEMAESLGFALDTLKRFEFDIEDLPDLPSFPEIIIDEKGIIKVMTDSGFVILSVDSLPEIDEDFLFEDIDYKRGQITRWGKSIIVDEGERVISDIVIISGDVTVNGTVEGDVVVIGGDIYVNSTGYIRGDATAVGGRVKKEEGAKVAGTTVSMSVPFVFLPSGSWMQAFEGILIFIIVLSLFFSALSISLFPKPIKRISSQLSARPIKSFFFGYLLYLGAFLIWLLLLVSIIGIPLALLGQPIALLIVVVFGYAAINVVLGEKIFKEQSTVRSFFYGILITTAVPLFLLISGYLTNMLVLFILNALLLAFLLFILLPFGLGAATLARFGFPRRKKDSDKDKEISETALTSSE